ATKPSLHRITANREDDWNRRSRPFGSESAGVATRNEHRHLTANGISRQRGQTIELTFRKTVFDRHVLALDISGCVQSTTECVDRSGPGDPVTRNPPPGIAGCCARAASGHATAAPPSRAKNFRRRM